MATPWSLGMATRFRTSSKRLELSHRLKFRTTITANYLSLRSVRNRNSCIYTTRRSSADAEQALCFFDSARLPEKLEGKSAVTLFQNNPQKAEPVTFQAPKNVLLCSQY